MSDEGTPLTEEQFLADIEGCDPVRTLDRLKSALQTALDVRKFEIELYWKRATYFWAFIAAIFIAYATIMTKADRANPRYGLQELLAGLGTIFSVGWWYVIKGSRFWQKNWEKHVDRIEDRVHGPLYKAVYFDKGEEAELLGAGPYSVSKLNQIIVGCVGAVWFLLTIDAAVRLSPLAHRFAHQAISFPLSAYDLGAFLGVVVPVAVYLFMRKYGRSHHQSGRADGTSGLLRRP